MSGNICAGSGEGKASWGPEMRGPAGSSLGSLTEQAKSLGQGLREAIEEKVVPYLVARHVAAGHDPGGPPVRALAPGDVTPDEVEQLAGALTNRTSDDAVKIVTAIAARGMVPARLRLELLAPAARRLGDLWTEDSISFADVSAALSRLHAFLRTLDQAAAIPVDPARCGTILLLGQPGDRHLFGLAMVEAFFVDAGWTVSMLASCDERAALDAVSSSRFDVVGLSLARVDLLGPMSATIARLRGRSCNPQLRVLVGGPPFIEAPDRFRTVGADATAADAKQAVLEANRLLERRAA
jgi:methanogenic corrinoid protein MtbC1